MIIFQNEDLRFGGRATIAAIPSSKSEQARNSIYFTRPPTQHAAGVPSSTTQVVVSPLKPRNVDFVPARSQAVSSAKKQVAWADEVSENDVFDFQPDSQALQSILSNTGINFDQMRVQNTSRVTLAGGRLTPYRRPRQSFREVCFMKRMYMRMMFISQ
ncbi:hypothetical protein OS493_010936 [Desmophyllum pertusum]|uniref:Uncharacterized protein n=1 Tax=Desmophyllum pertusum TaxID=174260 RepID=A0A9W9ZEG6_9CNID|nr:hypothetical protein OS493_010936 [Desmophyllum pertusum]